MYQPIIRHIRQYVHPSEGEIHLFVSKLSKISLARKKFLLQPGAHIKHEYFVIKGCLKAYYLDAKGNRHIIQFAIENWWVGDFDAFYNDVPSKLHIESIESSTLFSISYDDLQELFITAPIFERYFRILVTSAFIAQRKRILSSLEKDTKQRYLEFCKTYPNIEDRVPNYDIANYLGVSAESISRIRRKMKSNPVY
ncbi:Crp/Fnr family transcriptional regulator [Aquimarina addita]|uniref:Crp/Fnr family transcriptional regulator n=1 Tax=Aquimarina addita TaxID=870485 RepID=A0ABP6UL86_9FLAO